ncbi:MAG TPA: HAD family hydrolase [Mobilitalea sp.]|nr:HAD family hydrolase [Mobilitalea sp.]
MNTVLFDLDGTLLPMDQKLFMDTYFTALAAKMAPYGLEPNTLMKSVWEGTRAMVENDGSVTNSKRFWDSFSGSLGENIRKLEYVFEDFYRNEFTITKRNISTNKFSKECIRVLKEKGYTLVLATNPLFPRIATYHRIEWAGLNSEDFELVTTYENSSFCKPNLNYYKAILETIGKKPEECIMVGNDVKEDMCVTHIGMGTYLLKDCLINSSEEDITAYRQGDFPEFMEFINDLPVLDKITAPNNYIRQEV